MLYKTSDFYTSAYLKAKGFPLTDIEREGGGRCFFLFDLPSEEVQKRLLLDYHAGRASIDPRQFASAIKSLKALLHAAA